nr:hypothetical protein [Salinispora arenicola]
MIRAGLHRRGIGHTIPERADQQANRRRRGSHGGRPPVFDKQLYKHRNDPGVTSAELRQVYINRYEYAFWAG